MRSPQGDRASGGFLEIIRESRFRPARTLRTADRTRNSSSIAGALDTQAQNSGTTEHAVRAGVSQESVRHQRTVLGRGNSVEIIAGHQNGIGAYSHASKWTT
jgi:hypothetical protein